MHGEMRNCINNRYCDINSDKSGTCKYQNGFSGQLCDKLRDNDSDCTNSNDNIAESFYSTKRVFEKPKQNKNLIVHGLDCTVNMKKSFNQAFPQLFFTIVQFSLN
uniref:EGF-like domain-containing protein n=1 Tax=Strongyloides venezuelensis TaxID=75913 RepID=A0A0K0EWZ3_STRVS